MRVQGCERRSKFRVDDVVEVCSEREILSTLDARGELDGLPFMPEMLQFCGRRFRIDKLAVKTCDTINLTDHHRMRDAVHLEDVRCDGLAHGGCQARCLIFWKEAWLKAVGRRLPDRAGPEGIRTAETLLANTRRVGPPGEEIFSCQATELMRAAPEELRWWDLRIYVRDVRSGNVDARSLLRSLAVMLFNKFQGFSRRYLPGWLAIRNGRRFPFIEGTLDKTPQEVLNLKPGELVRIKSKKEIFETLDRDNRNRGLSFDCEMLRYCGREMRVLDRIETIIDEKTGKMLEFKNPCIAIEGATCAADYHLKCPRAVYPYWREIWLQRVE